MELFKLSSGALVLDREDRDGNALRSPVKYANRAQAQRAADKLRARGYAARVVQPRLGPVFYIGFE